MNLKPWTWVAAVAALGGGFLFVSRTIPCGAGNASDPKFSAKETSSAGLAPSPAASETTVPRPLTVRLKSASHEWTGEDATEVKVIEKIAHNPDEFIRMAEENDRIKRRQLVYRNETLPALLERNRSANGQTLKEFTLPALDGREVEVEVTEIHEESSLQGGTVIGRVKGRRNSMVSVGFVKGYESFNIISPDDGLYLTADAREPGEVVVKEIDPGRYAPLGGHEPDFILTQEPLPKTHDH